MKPHPWLALILLACALPAPAQDPTPSRQRELTRFVRQECGFCHGLKLTGGLGAPLTAAALEGRPIEAIAATILYGRTGTAMPGWAPFLTEAEAGWVGNQLLKGFPE